MKLRVLVVDDDIEIGVLLSDYLKKYDIACSAVTDGAAMFQELAQHEFDLLLLDVMLPGEDGLSLLGRLRQHKDHQKIPVLMVSARGEFDDKIAGLDIGADDYVTKPFDARELVARIHTVLRRSQADIANATGVEEKDEIFFGSLRLSRRNRELTTATNTLVPLSNAEFRLLMAFIQHPETVLSRDQLIDFARGKSANVFDRSIDLLVSRLRQKLDDDSRQPSLLKTIRGEGYMFTPGIQKR